MIYDEQLRMPLSISLPSRFAGRGARTRHWPRPSTSCRPAWSSPGSPTPSGAIPGCAPVARARRRRSRGAKARTSPSARATRSGRPRTSPGRVRRGSATCAPRCRGGSRSRATSRCREATEGAPGDQEYELYDLSEDPYELRNLAHDPAYKPLLDDMLARLHELEKERLGPVKVAYYARRRCSSPAADRTGGPRRRSPTPRARRRPCRHPRRLRPAAVRRSAPDRPRLRGHRR